jgi:hypothetical protein
MNISIIVLCVAVVFGLLWWMRRSANQKKRGR